MEINPMAGQFQRGRIWFANGFWWYHHPTRAMAVEISSLMRRNGFRRGRIARSLGLSERSFHRLIKESLDMPPGIWLRGERAVSARYRLRGGASVKELAFEYGFKHPGDFSDEFKRWHGAPPASFIISEQDPRLPRKTPDSRCKENLSPAHPQNN